MIDKEYVGYWWLPDNVDKKTYGILKVGEDNKLELNLCGELKEQFNYKMIKVINGFTKDGAKITLLNNNIRFSNLKIPGIPTVIYNIQYVIVGENFCCIDDIKINSVISRYTDLSKWIGIAPFERKIEEKEKEFVLRYKLPERRKYILQDKTVIINFSATMDGDSLNECTINQKTSISFEDLHERTFNFILDLVNDFSEFLTLCIGERVSAYEIEAITEKGKKLSIICNGIIFREDIKKRLYDIFIPYSLIQEEFQKCLENWYDKNEKLKPIINYVVEAHGKVFTIPMSFLKIVQALEAFSRRMRNNCKMDIEEHKKRISYIIDKIDKDDYKNWLSDRLRYSNEPNLSSRVKALLTELEFVVNLTNKDKKKLANMITLTRNYYTHFDESNKSNAMNANQIWYASIYILLGLKVLIMLELGLDKKIIKNQIDSTNQLYFLEDLKSAFDLKTEEKDFMTKQYEEGMKRIDEMINEAKKS